MNTETAAWERLRQITPADAAARASLRPMLAPYKGGLAGPEARPAYDEIMERVAPVSGVTFEWDTVGGIDGWWVKPAGATERRAILFLHGGWFVFGSAKAYRNFAGHVAQRAGIACFVPDYRLAPEHPLPAAIDDARAAYDGLVSRGFENISIVGDSAGGTLAIELLAALSKDEGAVRAASAVLLSPVTDLTLSAPSWETRDEADLYFTKAQAQSLVAMYLGATEASDPRASALNLDLTGLPPIYMIAGDDEMLLDDSRNFVRRAVAAGVDAKLDIWEGMLHVFPNQVGLFEASDTALNEIAAFLKQQR